MESSSGIKYRAGLYSCVVAMFTISLCALIAFDFECQGFNMSIHKSLLLCILTHISVLLADPVNSTESPNITASTQVSSSASLDVTASSTLALLPSSSYIYICLIDDIIDATIYSNILGATSSYVAQSAASGPLSLILNNWCPWPVSTSGTMIWGSAFFT